MIMFRWVGITMMIMSVAQSYVYPKIVPGIVTNKDDFPAIMRHVKDYPEISITELYHRMEEKENNRLLISTDLGTAVLLTNENKPVSRVHLNPYMISSLIDRCVLCNTDTRIIKNIPGFRGWVLPFVSVLVFLGSMAFSSFRPFISRLSPVFANSNGAFNIIRPRENISHWAGSPEVFQECYEVISFLKNNREYKEIGAKVPGGILLEGPPGTGKTLLARGIASEVGASFFPTVGSEFVELYVGMGANRIRSLFEQARKNLPAIIFIDEIDAIGKTRNNINPNEEREQTLNQLLSEMDGFKEKDQILVIAATNRRDVLDPALLRPGRFDRIIPIPLPDTSSREKILRVHLENTKRDPSVNDHTVRLLAENTQGYSGAFLANIVNEACINAVREGRKSLSHHDLSRSMEKSMVGVLKTNDERSVETRRRVAIHEIGHAMLVARHNDTYRLDKISIQSTYNGAGGYTLYSMRSIEEDAMYTKKDLERRVMIMLAGKAAEALCYGNDSVSTGASQDLRQANELVHEMLRKFGMSDSTPHFFEHTGEYSEDRKTRLEQESTEFLSGAFDESYRMLRENKDRIEPIVDVLLTNGWIDGDEFVSRL
jgi:cell division protease FtsH